MVDHQDNCSPDVGCYSYLDALLDWARPMWPWLFVLEAGCADSLRSSALGATLQSRFYFIHIVGSFCTLRSIVCAMSHKLGIICL